MKTIRYISLVALLLMLAISATQAFADCELVSTNYWVCSGTFPAVTEYDFFQADEVIIFPAGTIFTGYAVDDGGGNDTIINNGTFYGLMGGELFSGVVQGNDTIINNGSVIFCPDGSCGGGIVGGFGGDDTLINNGLVEGIFQAGPGNDTVINRGTLLGNMDGEGDIYVAPPGLTITGPTDDTMTNSGTVMGVIHGDVGNDTIALEPGANGGSDSYLLVDGGDGEDTLVLSFDNADVDAAVLENASSGSITIDGETFEWRNFEHIVKGEPEDGRLNGGAEHNARTAAVYCSEYEDGGVIVYGIDENAEGYLLFSVSSEDAHAALQEAHDTNAHVMITEEDGQSLWALTSNELQVHDADGQYDFIFNPTICGIPLAS
jgi:hypothetical protein